MSIKKEIRKFMTAMARKGGNARAKALTPERRREIAAMGAAKRMENFRAKKNLENQSDILLAKQAVV